MNSHLPSLRLRKGEERRLKQGHLWVYSNEVDTDATPLRQFTAGQCVTIESAQGRPLGSAYVNANSLICARIYSRKAQRELNSELLQRRIEQALQLRQMLYNEPYYRLCFGEGDFLPGLVVDRFGDYLSVQLTTAGMEQHKSLILETLQSVCQPLGIYWRNDVSLRELEGLALYREVAYGQVPDSVTVRENGVEFFTSLQQGQKTGWFYDHRDNRARLQSLCQGKRVLDVFSYLGAWGLEAVLAGAREVHCIDSSQAALTELARNAQHNGVTERCHLHAGDAFDVLEELIAAKEIFDVVVVDPPAFVKRKKDLAQGLSAYQRINQLALQLLNNNGILISASCSHHVDADTLLGAVRQAAKNLPLRLQIIAQGHQAGDHPIHPAMSETEYLKCFFFRVIRE